MQCLSNGTTPVTTVQAEAREAGISFTTLRRASDKLGVLKRKGGMNSGWYWSLPKYEDAHLAAEDVEDAPFKKQSTFGTFGKEVSALAEQDAMSKHSNDDDSEIF